MDDPLRDRRPPCDLAERRQVIEISEEIGAFTRLAEVIEGDLSALDSGRIPVNWRELPVTGELVFAFAGAQDDTPALEISLTAMVAAVCQRCMQPFELPLATKLRLLLSRPSDEAEEYGDYEAWDLGDGAFSPIDLVEEVLIMALPLSAMHEHSDDCVEYNSTDVGGDRTTPFASLREQMDDGK